MNFRNIVWIWLLWTALALNPVESAADSWRDKINHILEESSATTIKINPIKLRLNMFSEIDPRIKQELNSLNTIDLKKWLFPDETNSKEWEPVYVLYPIMSDNWNEAWILLHWAPYKKDKMRDFIVFMMPLKQWWYFQILIAVDYENIPENIDNSFVAISDY